MPTYTRRLRWLTLLTALLTLFQAGAAANALRRPIDLAAQISLLLAFEFIAGVLWAGIFALTTVMLLQRRPGAGYRAGWLVTGFILYGLVRLMIFVRADYDRQRLPFLLAMTILVLIIPTIFLVRSTQGKARPTENVEHGSEP